MVIGTPPGSPQHLSNHWKSRLTSIRNSVLGSPKFHRRKPQSNYNNLYYLQMSRYLNILLFLYFKYFSIKIFEVLCLCVKSIKYKLKKFNFEVSSIHSKLIHIIYTRHKYPHNQKLGLNSQDGNLLKLNNLLNILHNIIEIFIGML